MLRIILLEGPVRAKTPISDCRANMVSLHFTNRP